MNTPHLNILDAIRSVHSNGKFYRIITLVAIENNHTCAYHRSPRSRFVYSYTDTNGSILPPTRLDCWEYISNISYEKVVGRNRIADAMRKNVIDKVVDDDYKTKRDNLPGLNL
jgi:hypothetical protein